MAEKVPQNQPSEPDRKGCAQSDLVRTLVLELAGDDPLAPLAQHAKLERWCDPIQEAITEYLFDQGDLPAWVSRETIEALKEQARSAARKEKRRSERQRKLAERSPSVIEAKDRTIGRPWEERDPVSEHAARLEVEAKAERREVETKHKRADLATRARAAQRSIRDLHATVVGWIAAHEATDAHHHVLVARPGAAIVDGPISGGRDLRITGGRDLRKLVRAARVLRMMVEHDVAPHVAPLLPVRFDDGWERGVCLHACKLLRGAAPPGRPPSVLSPPDPVLELSVSVRRMVVRNRLAISIVSEALRLAGIPAAALNAGSAPERKRDSEWLAKWELRIRTADDPEPAAAGSAPDTDGDIVELEKARRLARPALPSTPRDQEVPKKRGI